jgi:hypothetical protein
MEERLWVVFPNVQGIKFKNRRRCEPALFFPDSHEDRGNFFSARSAGDANGIPYGRPIPLPRIWLGRTGCRLMRPLGNGGSPWFHVQMVRPARVVPSDDRYPIIQRSHSQANRPIWATRRG